jgi:Zn-dependent protease
MRGAVKLFNLFGIPIYIHVTFLLLPVLFYINWGLKGVFVVLFVFTCVTLHELCHSLAARRFGIRVRGITLYPIGGVASITAYPQKPGQEFLIALAGPMFNIVFALVFFYPLYRILGPEVLFRPSFATWSQAIAYAFWINPSLAAFNLLPAFPMDGGRIFRAFLAKRVGFMKATRIAVGIGHFFALLFGSIGIMYWNFMLIIIAVFIYMAASSEEFQVELMEKIKSLASKQQN